MGQVLNSPLPPHKSFRLGMQPQLWKCKNSECSNLISDVNQKTIPRIYCSQECREEYVNERKRKERMPLPRECEFCGKRFTPKKKRTTKYCSQLCSVRKCRGVVLHSKCLECDKKMSIFGRKRFCSKRCKNLNYFKRRVEILNR